MRCEMCSFPDTQLLNVWKYIERCIHSFLDRQDVTEVIFPPITVIFPKIRFLWKPDIVTEFNRMVRENRTIIKHTSEHVCLVYVLLLTACFVSYCFNRSEYVMRKIRFKPVQPVRQGWVLLY